MLKRIWARGISFCLISAEKRQVSQKKISEQAPNQVHYPHLSIPSQLYPSASTQNKPVIFSLVYSEDTPAASSACHPVIELARSWGARSSGGGYGFSISKWESFSFGPPITHFCPNVKGFFAFFCPLFSGIFLDISCWPCHTSYVNWEKRGKFMLVLESFAALVFTLVYVMYLYVQPKVVKLYNSWRFS